MVFFDVQQNCQLSAKADLEPNNEPQRREDAKIFLLQINISTRVQDCSNLLKLQLSPSFVTWCLRGSSYCFSSPFAVSF